MSLVRPIARPVLPLFLLCAGVVTSVVWITAREARATSTAAPAVNEQLEQAMRQINGAGKTLGRGITADNRDESLAQIVKLQNAVITAKEMTPDTAAVVEADKRAAFLADYRKSLTEVLKAACDVEIAILDGKYDVAQDLMKTKLGALKKGGHDKFKGE
jgi:uncharacterized membrane protein